VVKKSLSVVYVEPLPADHIIPYMHHPEFSTKIALQWSLQSKLALINLIPHSSIKVAE